MSKKMICVDIDKLQFLNVEPKRESNKCNAHNKSRAC